MTEKTQPTSPIEPEGAMKFRPFTEEPDAEAHGLKFRPFTEDAPEAEGIARSGRATEDDTEGHMPLRKVGPAPAAPDEPGAPDAEAHVIKATEDTGIAPEGGRRSLTDDSPEAEGGWKRPLTEEPDTEDTEGHMPLKRGLREPSPEEPGGVDAEGHVIKATEDAGIAPEGGRRSFTEGDDDATGIEPDDAMKVRP